MNWLVWLAVIWIGTGLSIIALCYWWLTTWTERNALTPPSEASPYWFPRCKLIRRKPPS